MIEKEPDPIETDSERRRIGAKAERDMAFYLRRAFGDRKDVFVFHDLRLEHAGEVAQMDHLVLHRHGIFIIESKSVTGEIHITPGGQFIRHYGRGKSKGMESPVEQAKRQAALLKKVLGANKAALRDRKIFGLMQGGFIYCPIEIRVAISDQGIIVGEKHAKEVRKADSIPGEIEERISAHRRGGSLLNLDTSTDDGMYRFSDGELDRIRKFLLDQHRPRSPMVQPQDAKLQRKRAAAAPTESSGAARPTKSVERGKVPTTKSLKTAPLPQYLCSKCQSLSLRILHGKYGYYFKCDDCAGNTWIDTRIDGTDRKGRIRKSGREFFLVCAHSGEERLVFVNPA